MPAALFPPHSRWLDAVLVAAIFLVTLGLFLDTQVTQVGDSKYTLLLTQNLLSKGSFVLDDYSLSRKPEGAVADSYLDPGVYQLETFQGHLYDYFPPGTAILSAPFVLAADALGYSVVRQDGTYDPDREISVQRCIASLLMALLAVTFYRTARLLLPPLWSVWIALGGALGTQVWSTASRALWGHTWGLALLGYALYLLLACETRRRRLSPVLLATVLSWTYFVRPTNSVVILGFTVYLLCFHREHFLRYALTGATWFVLFVAYSWSHFGTALPSYYQASRLSAGQLWEALPGNLISPSRGLFVYVPVTLFVGYLAARHWRRLAFPRLAWLAGAVGAGQLAAVSCFIPWWGGGCYGPRYTSELVPWLVLLATLGVRAALDWRDTRYAGPGGGEWSVTLATGLALLLVSVGIQARGATAVATGHWNESPVSVDEAPARVWDWRYPQILADLVDPPPAAYPRLETGRIDFARDGGKAFQLWGWSGGEPEICWTQAHRASLVFALDKPTANALRFTFSPYLHGRRLRRQRVEVVLNGRRIAYFIVREIGDYECVVPLPAGALARRNLLLFKLPDATTPQSLESNYHDARSLALAFHSLELAESPAPVEFKLGPAQP